MKSRHARPCHTFPFRKGGVGERARQKLSEPPHLGSVPPPPKKFQGGRQVCTGLMWRFSGGLASGSAPRLRLPSISVTLACVGRGAGGVGCCGCGEAGVSARSRRRRLTHLPSLPFSHGEHGAMHGDAELFVATRRGTLPLCFSNCSVSLCILRFCVRGGCVAAGLFVARDGVAVGGGAVSRGSGRPSKWSTHAAISRGVRRARERPYGRAGDARASGACVVGLPLWADRSAVRTPPLQGGCRRFESASAH